MPSWPSNRPTASASRSSRHPGGRLAVCRHIVLHDFQVHPYRQHLGIVGKQDVEKRIDGGEMVAVEAVGLGEEAIIDSMGCLADNNTPADQAPEKHLQPLAITE